MHKIGKTLVLLDFCKGTEMTDQQKIKYLECQMLISAMEKSYKRSSIGWGVLISRMAQQVLMEEVTFE